MGKIEERGYWKLIKETSDRHANKIDIILCKDGFYHCNFRNLQIKLTPEQFQEWQEAFKVAKEKLGNRMENDI